MTKTVVTPAYPDERGVQSFQESRVNLISDSCVDKALTLKLEQLVLYIDTPCQKRTATLRAVFEVLPRQVSIIDTLDIAAADAQVLILHTPPVESVALALQSGQGVTTAISDWRSCAEALLTFFRKNRQRSLIVVDTAFLSDPQKLLESLGLELPDDLTKKFPSRPDAIFRILATEALRHDMLANTLAGELEASATISASEQSQADIEIARERYVNDCAELASLRAAQAEFALEKGDKEALLRELFALQGKLQASQQNAERLNQQLQQLRQGLESTEAILAKRDAEKQTQLEEIEQMRSAFGTQAQILHESEAKVKTLHDQINHLLVELENAKVDSETRKEDQDTVLRELFALQGKLQASQQNAEQLNQQLQMLSHAQARELNENETKVKMLSDQISGLRTELENTKIDSESRNDEIIRIRASKSFRITQPIRWLHSALRRRR